MSPVGPESNLVEKRFHASEVEINYAEGASNGPPLILIHGLGRRWQVLQPMINGLAKSWHLYAPDLRGHGKSARVPHGYRVIQYAEDIRQFLRERVKEPAVLFGHSLGGMVAMWIAAQEPSLVKALILGDNTIYANGLEGTMYETLFTALRELAARGGSVEEIAQGLAKIQLQLPGLDEMIPIGDLPGNDEAYLRRWAVCLQHADPEAYSMTLDRSTLEGWDAEAVLHGIRCPALLLQANPELGGLMSDEEVKHALEVLPLAKHVMLPTVGHALYMQQPVPVLQAVNDFLQSR